MAKIKDFFEIFIIFFIFTFFGMGVNVLYVYFTNISQIVIRPQAILLNYTLFPAVIISAVLSLFIYFTFKNENIKNKILSFILALAAIATMNGVFFTSGYAVFDGAVHSVKLNAANTASIVLSISIPVIFIIKSAFIMKNRYFLISVIALMQATVIFSPVKDYIKNHDTIKNRQISYAFSIDNDFFQFNRDKNLVVLVLDSFGDIMLEDILQEKRYEDIFKDFTRYSNYSAAYPYTPPSGLSFLANTVYDNIHPLYEMKDAVLSTDKNLQVYLKNKGWRIKQGGKILPYYASPDLQDNAAGIDMKSVYENDYKNLANITLFRIMPSFFKPYFSQNIMEETAVIEPTAQDAYKIKNNEWDMWLYDALGDIDVSYSDKPVFFFAHLNGAHSPLKVGSDMNINKDGVDITEQAKASLILAEKFINKLKSAGVYDNTLMVITSDHGHGPNLEFGRANPIMLVKEIGGGEFTG